MFGAGSIGSCVGGMLARSHDVTLIGRKANVDAVRAKGLILQGAIRRRLRIDARESISDLSPPDLLIVTTKAYATPAVIEACSGWPREDTIVLTLQNGLGNLEQLRLWRGDFALGGTTTMGASLISTGVVRVADVGRTVIGSDMNSGAARSVVAAFRAAGIPTKTTRNIWGEIWSKAIVNASINPITAILKISNGESIKNRIVSKLMMEISREGETVAYNRGICLPYKSMYLRTRAVARQTSSNKSSMLRDLELGRRTEIRNINGEICRMGLDAQIPTPLNAAMVAMIESFEHSVVEKG